MSLPSFIRLGPQDTGITCAVGATLLGIAYLTLAGAPAQLISINLASLMLGLIALFALRHAGRALRRLGEYAMVVAAIALLGTALIGEVAEGASRWVAVGPLYVQPSLIALPLMVLTYVRNRSFLSTSAMLVAAFAMALQPDRAMASVLVAGLAVQALLRPDRHVMSALVGSLLALFIAFARPDALPAMPFVDQIYYTSFDVSLLAGIAVIAGTVLLLVPALAGARAAPENRHIGLVFGTVWLTIIVAALLGNYPTPVVGYSGAAVLGYVLSLFVLPCREAPSRHPTRVGLEQDGRQKHAGDDLNLVPVSDQF